LHDIHVSSNFVNDVHLNDSPFIPHHRTTPTPPTPFKSARSPASCRPEATARGSCPPRPTAVGAVSSPCRSLRWTTHRTGGICQLCYVGAVAPPLAAPHRVDSAPSSLVDARGTGELPRRRARQAAGAHCRPSSGGVEVLLGERPEGSYVQRRAGGRCPVAGRSPPRRRHPLLRRAAMRTGEVLADGDGTGEVHTGDCRQHTTSACGEPNLKRRPPQPVLLPVHRLGRRVPRHHVPAGEGSSRPQRC
jgi:hypothetical protein